MPITRRQFELGVDKKMTELMRVIHDFLLDNIHKAYDKDELVYLLPHFKDLPSEIIDKVLDKLVEAEAVEEGTIKGEKYYAYKGPLEL